MNTKQTQIVEKAMKEANTHGLWMGLVCGIVLGLIAGFAIGEHMGTKTYIVPLSEGVKT
jgi:F0F1-type ATP synthase assembly protein I